MALITPGPLAGSISGKVGGLVFSHGQYSDSVRVKSLQINPRSNTQSTRHSSLQTAIALWQSLTPASKLIFENNALLHPRRNRLNQTYFLSGYNYFCSLVLNLRSCNLRTSPDGDVEGLLDVGTYEEILAEPDGIICTFDAVALPANYLIVVYISTLSGAGRFRSPAGYYRQIGIYSAKDEDQIDITNDLFAAFGITRLTVGASVFSYVQFVDSISGLATARQYQMCYVQSPPP